MLEDLAVQFVSQSESALRAIGYGLVVLGAIIAGVLTRSKAELERSPYFALSALIILLVTVVQTVWLQSLSAMAGGYLWALMIAHVAALVTGGFFTAKIAMARSRDAFGHGWLAALAFIPLANFWLLLAPSKVPVSAQRTPAIPLLTGGLGVLLGFLMLIAAAVVSVLVGRASDRMVARARNDPALQKVGIAFLVRSQGLPKTLRQMADAARTPIKIDSVTTLNRIEAAGTELRRTYVVGSPAKALTDEFRTKATKGICAYGPFMPILRSGATIREVYVRADRSPIGEVLVTRRICGL
jgi:hypothetical protein